MGRYVGELYWELICYDMKYKALHVQKQSTNIWVLLKQYGIQLHTLNSNTEGCERIKKWPRKDFNYQG